MEGRRSEIIRYRHPGLDDPAIVQLIETQLVPLTHLKPKEVEVIRKDMPARLRRGVTFVACRDSGEAPVGFIHFMLHGELMYIDMLAVAPAAQRRRFGAALMEQAEGFARSRGCRLAKVMVDAGNRKGLRFYHKLGYQIIRTHSTSHCYELEKTW
ncbi:GNAT family N-acetyltransferase [Paenibacillus sp. JSM ZJ436]|uniref:GCN5-related N-acetyltransferase n=1 Tax=Paenibacillus algicola TaxID=2565926 RepID=A0A4P8XT85_9BACL|nr:MULTISPECIES: GNAT family N-acetyltransferase [Paenibacillus]QCT03919.1 GCN5-related N-acetyltransferase [Paenibacillus algicola]